MDRQTFFEKVQPFSMTSYERISVLFDSLEYIRENNIEGDFVECGVWRGGNVFGIAEYLSYYKMLDRKVWLFDTFEGMTPPEDCDVDLTEKKAEDVIRDNPSIMCKASLEDVKSVMTRSSLPQDKILYVVGDVCETLLQEKNIPEKISLLRLDTDWYKSTIKELEVLFPKLSSKGVLIVDDYGHWKGSKKAVDEYFNNQDITLEKIDYTGVRLIKK